MWTSRSWQGDWAGQLRVRVRGGVLRKFKYRLTCVLFSHLLTRPDTRPDTHDSI